MTNRAEVFTALREVMLPYAKKLSPVTDSASDLYLNGRHPDAKGKARFFGAVQVKKNYVSFHLMPVYVNPSLLEGVSPALRKRMQGKSCFNFEKLEPALFTELAALTKRAFTDFQSTDKPRD